MKTIAIGVIALVLLGGGVFIWGLNLPSGTSTSVDNVSMVDGRQIVEITAKGGYQPKVSQAKANLPTMLRFKTEGTFDCSSSVRISSLGVEKTLPQSGTTDIDIGLAEAGVLQGSCGMGMYPFAVNFGS